MCPPIARGHCKVTFPAFERGEDRAARSMFAHSPGRLSTATASELAKALTPTGRRAEF